jgi:bisanhydrobacterioruberin hydratase
MTIVHLTTRLNILLTIIVIFHTVGIFGLLSDDRAYFLSLSPMNLGLAMACLLLAHKISLRLLIDVLIVGVVGFSAEWIGVHTGWLFGDYSYGASLGVKLFDIPIMIAVNWAMLSFAAIACVMHLKVPVLLKAILSALLMTLLDFLIESVAIKSDFWSWTHGEIPFYNYVCWFLVAFPLHFYLIRRKTPEQNRVSVGLFGVLVVFFAILNYC